MQTIMNQLQNYLEFEIRVMIGKTSIGIALLGRKILCMFKQGVLKLGLRLHFKKLLSKIHIGKDGRKRSPRFQSIFGSFLLDRHGRRQVRKKKSEKDKNKKQSLSD